MPWQLLRANVALCLAFEAAELPGPVSSLVLVGQVVTVCLENANLRSHQVVEDIRRDFCGVQALKRKTLSSCSATLSSTRPSNIVNGAGGKAERTQISTWVLSQKLRLAEWNCVARSTSAELRVLPTTQQGGKFQTCVFLRSQSRHKEKSENNTWPTSSLRAKEVGDSARRWCEARFFGGVFGQNVSVRLPILTNHSPECGVKSRARCS